MRFKGTTPSGKDKDVNVYNFSMGTSELIILRDALQDIKKRTPMSIFTMMLRGRLDNMLKVANDTLRLHEVDVHPISRSPEALAAALADDADGFLRCAKSGPTE